MLRTGNARVALLLLLLLVLAAGGVAATLVLRADGRDPTGVEPRAARSGSVAARNGVPSELADAAAVPGAAERSPVDPAAGSAGPAGASGPHVRARVLDPRGRPLANETIELSVSLGGFQDITLFDVRSDGEGRVEVALGELIALAGELRPARVGFAAYRDDHGNSDRVSVPLPDQLAPVHDLGDVRLAPLDRLVAGRIVDSAGRPIAKASLRATLVEGADRSAWTAGDGSFLLLGDAKGAASVRLRASVPGARPVEHTVPVGTADVMLAIVRPGAIFGRVLHGVAGTPKNLRVRAIATGSDVALEPAAPHRDGRFRISGVPPGTYRVDVVLGPQREPLVRVDGVVVPEGENVWPPELAPLDLTSVLHSFVVRVRAADRAAVAARVGYRPAGSPEDAPWTWFAGTGRDEIAAAAAAIDVRVEASDYAPAERHDVVGTTVFELVHGRAVELYLDVPDGNPCAYEATLSGPALGVPGTLTRALEPAGTPRVLPAPPIESASPPPAWMPSPPRVDPPRVERAAGVRATAVHVHAAGELRVRVRRRCPGDDGEATTLGAEQVVLVDSVLEVQKVRLELP
jgi:hypothetical protein